MAATKQRTEAREQSGSSSSEQREGGSRGPEKRDDRSGWCIVISSVLSEIADDKSDKVNDDEHMLPKVNSDQEQEDVSTTRTEAQETLDLNAVHNMDVSRVCKCGREAGWTRCKRWSSTHGHRAE